MHDYRNIKLEYVGKHSWLNVAESFPTISAPPPPHLCAHAQTSNSYPDLIRLQRMHSERRHRDKYTAEIRTSAERQRW